MKGEKISLLSTFLNLFLAVSKLTFGFIIKSIALMADGVHSGLDVISSFITFLGIKISQKPVDETHPYGYYKAESIAGFLVTIILAISGIWILYEAIERILGEKIPFFSLKAILFVIFSIVLVEILARLKFYYGEKYQSLSLIADAEHSRADAISSVGVLIGLIAIKYFPLADAFIALGISFFVLFQAVKIGKEITDSLLDVANKEVEERIRKICQAHNIEISQIKTRKIGSANFAEVKIKLPLKLKVEEVDKITKSLEERVLSNIPELKYIVFSIEPYQVKRSVILQDFGRKICSVEGIEKIGPKKLGKRIIIPLENKKIAKTFGAKNYLILDKKEGKILRKEIIKNIYFKKTSPHGARFAKAVRADKVFTYQIGKNAKKNLENFGIEIEIIPSEKKIKDLISEIEKEN